MNTNDLKGEIKGSFIEWIKFIEKDKFAYKLFLMCFNTMLRIGKDPL